MKTKIFFQLLILVLFFGCSPDDSVVPTKEFHGSLFVTVKDPAGLPVNGASIVMGNQTATTNEDGTYFFTQVILTGDDYLKVEKSGYFKGSRRFNTEEAQTQFVRVTLMPQEEIGIFSGEQSASISIDSRSTLTFPDHAVTRSDGSLYSGNVHVLASPIYGDDPQLSEKMPGALTALDESGETVALGSFGMLAVELQADNGEVLEIAASKTVEIELAIPDKQLSQAPSTIPLWYFDEEKGYWMQEGEAARQGNVYIAQVPHFSVWNWDVVFTLVDWETRFIYSDGSPAHNVQICLTAKSLNSQRCAYTNSNGWISGAVPANVVFELNVTNECGSIILSEELGPFSNDITLETKTLDITEQDYATISGTALQCDGSPLTAGYVRVRTPKNNFILPIQAGGHFEGGYVYCTGDYVTLTVYDILNDLVSLPRVISFDRNLNAVSVSACEQVSEFLRYKITGFSPEYVYYSLELENTNFQITKIVTLDSIGVKGKFGFTFDGKTIGQYTGYTISGNRINIPNGQIGYVTNMSVNVTEYGDDGEYIRGDFSGKINVGGNGAGGPSPSDFNGSFSVKNE